MEHSHSAEFRKKNIVMRPCLRGLCAVVLWIFAGCGSPTASSRIIFPESSIHGQSTELIMDTGSSSSVLFASRAKKLGLKFDDLTEPTSITIAGQQVIAPLPVFRFEWYMRPFIPKRAFSADGLVGWPEVRGDLIAFDADNRITRHLDSLPPETATWMKLRVIPNDWLLLEVPLGDGKVGTVEIDTGSPFGVELAPGPWKEWRAKHREASETSHLGGVLSFGLYRVHSAWAEQFHTGTICLTNVVVENMPQSQADFIRRQNPQSKEVWSLGLYALTRMDLIVDAKNGWAYVHPKSTTAPPYPGLKRPMDEKVVKRIPPELGNWTVDANLLVSGDNLLMLSGNKKSGRHDFAGALAEYTRSLQMNPQNADAYSRRGVVRQILGDFPGAISDYEKYIELRPETSDWERLYRYVILPRVGRAPEDYSKTLAGCKEGWTRTVGLFLAGKLNEKELLEAAKKRDGEPEAEQKSLSLFYIAMSHLAKGDNAAARETLKKFQRHASHEDDEYEFCKAELARLK